MTTCEPHDEEAAWNSDTIRVWPFGEDSPWMALTELAAWRADQARIVKATGIIGDLSHAKAGHQAAG